MLPKAVREQAERAEAAHQALLAGNTAPATPPAPVAPPVEAPAPAPAAPPIEAPAAPTPPPTPAPVAPTAADAWELKYRVLEGKYRAEVPRLAEQVRELTDRLNSLSAAPATPPAPAAPSAAAAVVREQYGDDFTDAVATVANDLVKPVRDELASKLAGVEERAAQQARHGFFSELASLVPNWQAIDAEAGFTAFLDEFDPLMGRTRREFFNAGDKANDAAQVAAFFAAYLRGRTPAPAPAAPVPPPSVEHLIEPDSSRHSEAPPGKKLWSRQEVARFYSDARASNGQPFGRYSKAEYERISADIDAAISEGRYRG
jgi:hypothetical protein